MLRTGTTTVTVGSASSRRRNRFPARALGGQLTAASRQGPYPGLKATLLAPVATAFFRTVLRSLRANASGVTRGAEQGHAIAAVQRAE